MKRAVKALLILSVCAMNAGCQDMPSCEEDIKPYTAKEFNVKVKDLGPIGPMFRITGINPETNKPTQFEDESRLYIHVKQNLEIDDTVVKIAGANYFLIKKKMFDLKLDFSCKEGQYNGVQVDTLSKR